MPVMSLELLRNQHCVPRKGKEAALGAAEIDAGMAVLKDWQTGAQRDEIRREFRFADYFHTMAFVNAVASIAHREDHHPDLEVHYNRCVVRFSTHDVGGLSLNDLICAAKVEDLRVA